MIIASDAAADVREGDRAGKGAIISPAALDLPPTFVVDITDFVTRMLSLEAIEK